MILVAEDVGQHGEALTLEEMCIRDRGAMMLIDEARAEQLYAAMGPARIISGGSAANTIAGLASFGGKGAFIGKVRGDELGKLYRHDLTSLGVAFGTACLLYTSRCV